MNRQVSKQQTVREQEDKHTVRWTGQSTTTDRQTSKLTDTQIDKPVDNQTGR